MAQRAKGLLCKPGDLSSIPGSHMYVDRELTLQSHVLPYTMCLHSNKYDLSAQEDVGGSIQTTDVLHPAL